MTIELNHTLVPAHDPKASARFLADILGLRVDPPMAHFTPVTLSNQVTLDYDHADDFESHHYAFLVTDQEFDSIFTRIKSEGVQFGSQPNAPTNGEINTRRGGRGLYFPDPDGHLMEIMTTPE